MRLEPRGERRDLDGLDEARQSIGIALGKSLGRLPRGRLQNAEIAIRRLAVILGQGATDQHPGKATAAGRDMLAVGITVPLA